MEEISIKELNEVIQLIRQQSGVDFSEYALASLRRRVLRLMQVRRIPNVPALLDWIRSGDEHTRLLVEEITVNTTEMFRDPAFWQVLKTHVLPEMAQKELIRIWHAACSTGEEVYSMAIMLKEEGLYDRCRIVASDINEDAMSKAQSGRFPLRSLKMNENNYKQYKGSGDLSPYYEKNGHELQFDPGLLETVRFRKHDLVKDSPFSTFDLVLCRNVMIYFTAGLQEKVMDKINQSMFRNSFLGIGLKESLQWNHKARSFAPVSVEEKIFKKTMN